MWNGNQTNKTKSTEGTIFLHKKKNNNFSSAYRFRSSNLKTDNKAKNYLLKKKRTRHQLKQHKQQEYIAQSEKNREEEEN